MLLILNCNKSPVHLLLYWPVCLGEPFGYHNTNYSFKTKLQDPIFLGGTWLCGVAEVILPASPHSGIIPALSLVSDSASSSPSHVTSRNPEAADATLPPRTGGGDARAASPSKAPARGGAGAARPASSQQPARTPAKSLRGSSASSSPRQLPPVGQVVRNAGDNTHHPPPSASPSSTGPFVKIPDSAEGPKGSICEVLSYTFKENSVNSEQGLKVLKELRSVPIPDVVENQVFDFAEKTALLTLVDGSTRRYSWSVLDSPAEWLANLSTFADSEAEASQWIQEAVACWNSLLDAHAPRARKPRAQVSEWGGVGGGDSVSLVFVYCDITQSALIADGKDRCIRVLPVESRNQHYPLFPVHYFICDRKILDYIHIELRTRSNSYVEFRDTKQPTVVVLHFRRIS